jgi:hypothetical protein
MQGFSQKYTIIALLQDNQEGDEYASNNWPLHITIADTFAVEWKEQDLDTKLSELLLKKRPVTSVVDRDEFFGSEKEVQVSLLDMSKELVELHYDVVRLLKVCGAIFNDPQYIEEGFRAHANVQSHARLKIGDTVTLTRLAVIDMFPHENPYQRKILKIINLSES